MHHKHCRRLPVSGDAKTCTVFAAGSPCTDWSTFGSRRTTCGPTSTAFVVMLAVILQGQPDVVIHENVIGFPLGMLVHHLGAMYQIDSAVLDPTSYGYPINRPRRYTVMVRHSAAIKLAPLLGRAGV